uniref:NADH-ubiquinone oxidoreductase chain 2 n=1 Tax=Enteromius pobeguini TaxID=1001912 RepID=A0A1Q2T882_9TELE|nr:NADH dehydrogenase subunit 2 [Enteromius pobeguini]BAW87821.1 NADH dehydrogenase subunit 2 [Enteromius pobeguini]
MTPYVFAIMLLSLGLGTTLTFASSHWLFAWVGLEINTLAISPLMSKAHHPRAVEATTKYFLINATAAATMMFACTTNAWMTGEWNIHYLLDPLSNTILMTALAMKIGLAPMHFWVPEILQGLDLTTGLIVLTWQKLAPMALIIQMAQNTNPTLLTTLGILSALIGGWGGLNQTQLRKIMAFSSIAHMGWMIIVMQMAPQLALIALTTYIIMTTSVFLMLKKVAANNIASISAMGSQNPVVAVTASLTLLSLAGLPPLTGFMPKLLILQELTKQDMPMAATTVALSSLISLYFYLRLCYATALILYPTTTSMQALWRLTTTKNTLSLALFTAIALGLLPMTPIMLTLFT